MRWFRGANRESSLYRPGVSEEAAAASAVKLWESPLTAADYFVVDMETSGFSAEKDLILSLAAACFTGVDPQFTETMYELIRHEHLEGVPQAVWNLTGLSPEQVRAGRDLEQVLRRVLTLSVNRVWIAHHARHELSFLGRQARLLWKLKLRPIVVDTAVVAQALGRMTRVPTLDEVCAWLNVDVRDRHRADADVRMTAEVWRKEIALCQRIGLRTIAEVMDWTSSRAY